MKPHFLGLLFQVVSCDLEFVAVWIVKVNRVRDFVILEFEFDAAPFEFLLRGKKAVVVSAKGEMKHSDLAGARGRF